MIAKPETYQRAVTIFEDTGISITDTGKRYLGGAVGVSAFVEEFAERKIREWTQEVQCLSEIAISQPHAAFAALDSAFVTAGLTSRKSFRYLQTACHRWKRDPHCLHSGFGSAACQKR